MYESHKCCNLWYVWSKMANWKSSANWSQMQAIRGDREIMLQTGLIYPDAELQNVKYFTRRKHWNQLKPSLKVPFPPLYSPFLHGHIRDISQLCPDSGLAAAHLSWWPAPCTPPCAKQPALSLGQRFFLNSINCKISSSQPEISDDNNTHVTYGV